MKPEFILVTGANGSGKTTLIENNRATLELAGFQIIIPDDILQYATSQTDVSEVIKEHVDDVLIRKANFILESPFQFESLVKIIGQVKDAGYNLSMYQLFVLDAEDSVNRVKERYKVGGRFIDSNEVKNNFVSNMNHVASHFHFFDHSWFIDNSTDEAMKLSAEFAKRKLIQLNTVSNSYLRDLFSLSLLNKKISARTHKLIIANNSYSGKIRSHPPHRRLKF